MYHMTLSSEEAWVQAKACEECGAVKELRDFAVSRDRTHGPQLRCRACNYAIANNNIVEAASALREYLEAKQRLNVWRRQCKDLESTLDKAVSAKLELEERFEYLSTAVETVQQDHQTMRSHQAELEEEVSRSQSRVYAFVSELFLDL